MSKYKNPDSCIDNLISQINYVLNFKNVDRINAYINKINNLKPVDLNSTQPQNDTEISGLQRLHVQCDDNHDFKKSKVLKLIIAIAQTKIKALEAQQNLAEKDKYKAEKEEYKNNYNTLLSKQKSAPQIQPQPVDCAVEISNYGALKTDYDNLQNKYKTLETELNLYKTDIQTINENIKALKKNDDTVIQGDIDVFCGENQNNTIFCDNNKQNGGYKNKSKSRRTRRRRSHKN